MTRIGSLLCILSLSLSQPESFAFVLGPLTMVTRPLLFAGKLSLDTLYEQFKDESPANIQKQFVQQGFLFDSHSTRLDGTWTRQSSEHLVPFLMAHGVSLDDAHREANRPYQQSFHRETVTPHGIVFTIDVDDGRRIQTYHLGEWTEQIQKAGALYLTTTQGQSPPNELQRKTFWNQSQHITTTSRSDGTVETTKRYLDYTTTSSNRRKQLIVERHYQQTNGTIVSCQEIFVPLDDTISSPLERVVGCVANVRIQTSLLLTQHQPVQLDGDSDAMVSRGLLALLSQVVQGQSSHDVLQMNPETITDRMGLRSALSQGRNDGLASMLRTMQRQIVTLLQLPTENDDIVPTITVHSNPIKKTVAMLLSGGVDSSVALNVLVSQGYAVTAFYLKIWLEDELAHLGQCPWEDDYNICIDICKQAGVPLESISLQQEYKQKVISYTITEARRGRTPNPDIMCNSRVKFGCFYEAIEGRGFDYVASGHYAQVLLPVDDSSNNYNTTRLLRAPDPVKDQSYFLCALAQDQLKRVLFPIGHLEKHEVRQLAHEYDLPNKDRPDSQGLCFLGKVKFEDFLAAYLGESPGDIVDAGTGTVIGQHKGVWYHTVGQRKGIGKVLDPKATARGPWYVVAKDPEKSVVYASNEYDEDIFNQARSNVYVEDIHWISGSAPASLLNGPARFDMKIRHGPRIVTGSLKLLENGIGNVKLDQKDGGLAPGQYVVFYDPDGNECYGGGVISERHWAQFLLDRLDGVASNICQKETII